MVSLSALISLGTCAVYGNLACRMISDSPAGTIMHLQARKQRSKLQMFQRLWRILMLAVIAVAAFFVVSSLSLSNRLDEGE